MLIDQRDAAAIGFAPYQCAAAVLAAHQALLQVERTAVAVFRRITGNLGEAIGTEAHETVGANVAGHQAAVGPGSDQTCTPQSFPVERLDERSRVYQLRGCGTRRFKNPFTHRYYAMPAPPVTPNTSPLIKLPSWLAKRTYTGAISTG